VRARPTAVSAATVSVRAVSHLVDLGATAGIRRDILLGAAGATDADLHDPEARMPLAAEIAMWQTLAAHISDPEFGVRAGAASRLRTAGLIGYVARFSATLRGALQRVERYGRLFTEAVQFTLTPGRPEIALPRSHPALGPGHVLAESYRLAALLQGSRELTGIHIVPAEVGLTYAQPSSVAAHHQHFRGPLRFGAQAARLVFRASDLDLPIAGADEMQAGYLSKYAPDSPERVPCRAVDARVERGVSTRG
jgi:hypothetical protein